MKFLRAVGRAALFAVVLLIALDIVIIYYAFFWDTRNQFA